MVLVMRIMRSIDEFTCIIRRNYHNIKTIYNTLWYCRKKLSKMLCPELPYFKSIRKPLPLGASYRETDKPFEGCSRNGENQRHYP